MESLGFTKTLAFPKKGKDDLGGKYTFLNNDENIMHNYANFQKWEFGKLTFDLEKNAILEQNYIVLQKKLAEPV